jgi:hypothetical protein
MNNKKVIAEIERKAKELTRASIRISRFLNLFVLRSLENNKDIPNSSNSFIQCVCTALLGKYKSPKKKGRDMLHKITNLDDACKAIEYQFTNLDYLINFICDYLEVNVQNMLIFIIEARLKKYLR